MAEHADIQTAAEQVGSLEQHPQDGWQMADPYPVSNGTKTALTGLIKVLVPMEAGIEDIVPKTLDYALRFMRYMHPLTSFGLIMAIKVLDWSPIWRFKSWRRIRSLPVERGSEIIASIAHSRLTLLRLMVMGVRAIVATSVYDHKDVHRQLDYHPEPWMAQRIEFRKRLLAGQEPRPSDDIGPYSHVRVNK